ncbi:DinB family protein [Armatimonas sp.]|uniref:DinB family protein n=1 Tax=Armatimonas sp. TaxID=1872638 RepID=UPI0037538DA0
MILITRYRELYDYECSANAQMLTMIESIPEISRTDPRFQRALNLAAHLAACRENWLTWMAGEEREIALWFETDTALESLRPRYAAIEQRWVAYLAALAEDQLQATFTFTEADGNTYRVLTEGQIIQLNGHTCYHRGQIVLLVDQLGGETVDTDYIDWVYPRDPRYGTDESLHI